MATRPDPPDLGPFDPERFRVEGRSVVEVLADHLAAVTGPERDKIPVLPWVEPDAMVARWPANFDAPEDVRAFVGRVVEASHHLHHPRYVGHQVTSPLPAAVLLEFASAMLHNGSAIYEMGPASIAMERSALQFLSGSLGFVPKAAEGVLTSGGSAGNLTALLAARQAMAGFDVWTEGAHAGPPLCVLASDQSHYSVKRAVQIMGWGEGGAVAVPSDDAYRLRPDALGDALVRARATGRRVIGVVAAAASTATGAIDPLDAIADFCAQNGLWMHVDGAHGASLALSPRLRGRLAGIERADSVVWDAHKMMLVPALVTAVLFREGRRSYEAFSQEASYLFPGAGERREWFDVGMRTIECTKRMMGFVLYGTLAVHGARYLGAYVERMVALAAWFAARLRECDDFELAVEPDCNIVCFRYTGGKTGDRDALQARIRQRIIRSGAFYLVQTGLRTGTYLRTTLVNPRTTEDDLEALLDAVREAARALAP